MDLFALRERREISKERIGNCEEKIETFNELVLSSYFLPLFPKVITSLYSVKYFYTI